MVEKRPIDKLIIKGFKTLQDVELELGKLNVLIGPNGAGKSNLVSFFRMLHEMASERFQIWTAKRGGAGRLLTFGASQTPQMWSRVTIGQSSFEFALEHTVGDRFVFVREKLKIAEGAPSLDHLSGGGHLESICLTSYRSRKDYSQVESFYSSISGTLAYHLNDTSDTAGANLIRSLHDNRYLRSDGENLAAILYKLKHFHSTMYEEILDIVKLALPFFGDFILEPVEIRPDEFTIQLMWQQKDWDYPLLASLLSDGSLRFICLVTALMQPDPPSTIIIDEPELGLHPYAIHLLGALLRSASKRMQVIVATQSTLLLDEFDIDDLIVVELENGVSIFKRLEEEDFDEWLKDFSVGELWSKNVLGGGIP